MKTFAKILAGIFIIIWVLITACYIYIKLNGRQWVTTTLTQAFEQPVTLKDIHFLFPLGARITDLNAGGIFQVKDVQLQIGLPDLVHKRFHLLLLNLSEPVVTIQRNADSKIVLGNSIPPALESVKETPGPPPVKNSDTRLSENSVPNLPKSMTLVVDYLLVTKGQITFLDYSRGKIFQLTLRDVNLKAQNVAVPIQSVNTKFDLSAVLFKEDLPLSGSRIQARGWANFFAKDMQATLDVIEPDGKVDLSARLAAKNNDLAVDGKVHITNLMQSSGVEIAANFHSQTKMDDIQFDSISFSGNVGYNAGVDAKNIGEHFEELGKKFYKENIQDAPAVNQELMNKEVPAP